LKLVPTCTSLKTGVKIAGTDITIPKGKWVDIPLHIALRHKQDPTLVMDWRSADEHAIDWDGSSRHISIASPFNPYDGYGLVGIHSVLGLEEKGFRLHISNAGGIVRSREALRRNYPKVVEVLDREITLTKWGLCHIQPKEFGSVLSTRRIAWTMWEATRLPKGWNDYFKLVERVIVPSKGQVEIFRNSGIWLPIDVIPDGIDFDAFVPIERPERKVFTFITWGRLTSRKCPQELAWCFQRAFPKIEYPDVRLIFKTRQGQMGGGLIPPPKFKDSRIKVINEEWDLPRLVQFCHEADCAVFLSRGEGFGQPAVQAMATGLPVILSDHSGQSDFSNSRYNYPIGLDAKKPYVSSSLGASYGENDSLEWWNPDFEQTIDVMKEVYRDRDKAKNKGAKSAQWVRKQFSIGIMVDKLAKLLRGLD
jgi:glycosyltransferase involved in cell wall biosynthesis